VPQAHGRLPPQPAAGLVVLDHHVAQPRPDAPADPPGMAAAVLYLALDAALVILAQVRQPGQDNGGAGADSITEVCRPIPVSIRTLARHPRR
jgi:hypothetical protein